MSKNILVVEDNEGIREMIGYMLNEEHYEVHLCEDAGSFRKEIFNRRPDMVILDIMLPDGNGIDLCCEIKSDYRTGHIPVMMMSAHATLRDVRKKCQADDFISKPFDIDNFMGKVSYLVS
jgi:DNA-binding response OmpR family regulator